MNCNQPSLFRGPSFNSTEFFINLSEKIIRNKNAIKLMLKNDNSSKGVPCQPEDLGAPLNQSILPKIDQINGFH
jgi:hypothetical protein